MITTNAAHRTNRRPCFFSAFYAALRGLRAEQAAMNEAEQAETARTATSEAALLPKWDVAEFLADSRAAQALARRRRQPRRKAVEIDPQALLRAERMVASIHARSATA